MKFFSSQTLCKIFIHNVLAAIVNNFFADLRDYLNISCTFANEITSSNNKNFVPVKEYEINKHTSYLGTNNSSANDETPMNVLIVKYPEFNLTILMNAELAIFISTLEEII